MIVLYFIGVVFIVAIFAAVVLAVASRKGKTAKSAVDQPIDKTELDEAQAAVTASTWTSLNPPS